MYKIDEKTGLKYFDDSEVVLLAMTNILPMQLNDYMEEYDLKLPDRKDLYDIEFLPEFAGRHCYMSFGKKVGNKTNESYIKNIIEHQHFSVLEHVSFTFIVRGASRGASHEIVRHRHLSFSQLSTRYSDEINFVIPNLIRGDENKIRKFLDDCKIAYDNYNNLLNSLEVKEKDKLMARKIIRSCARSLLPHAVEAPIVISGNLRSFREVIQKRYSEHAELEICDVFTKIREDIREECFNSMSDL